MLTMASGRDRRAGWPSDDRDHPGHVLARHADDAARSRRSDGCRPRTIATGSRSPRKRPGDRPGLGCAACSERARRSTTPSTQPEAMNGDATPVGANEGPRTSTGGISGNAWLPRHVHSDAEFVLGRIARLARGLLGNRRRTHRSWHASLSAGCPGGRGGQWYQRCSSLNSSRVMP